ncbi:MAG: hypothetical protein IKU30_01915 [Clostridia bacterium]|nr:hypothetical protein [Clostridia bacterium]
MIIKEKNTKLLKTILAVTLVSVIALTALVGCGGEEAVEDQSSTAESSLPATESSVNEVSEAVSFESSEAVGDESVNTEASEESVESSEATYESSTTEDASAPDEESSEAESSTPDEESSEPEIEIVGSGTKDDPFLLIPGESMMITTYEIGADETQYYGIYRVAGLDVTVKSEDLYIVCDGEKYTPKNGEIKFRVYSAMASDAILFEIANTSSETKTFDIGFANPAGTYANPVELDLSKAFEVSLEENDEVGYYYKHVAEKDGTIVFKLAASSDGFLAVTNNRSYAQRTTDGDGTEGDDGSKYVEIEVLKGDELVINVGALPNKRGKRPAIDITVLGDYK